MSDNNRLGLSPRNRDVIVGLIFFVLLIFGPIEPYGLIARIAYLIAIPTVVWLSLTRWGGRWNLSWLANDRITRTLVGSVAGALLVGAYLSFTSDYHSVCDQYVQTRDGRECVGDYFTVKGGDKAGASVSIVLAAIAIWFAIFEDSNPAN